MVAQKRYFAVFTNRTDFLLIIDAQSCTVTPSQKSFNEAIAGSVEWFNSDLDYLRVTVFLHSLPIYFPEFLCTTLHMSVFNKELLT